MDKEILIKEFTDAVKEMRRTHADGTYHWPLGEDKHGNSWAIVLGWSDGFEEDPEDNNLDGTWRICAKCAFQSKNSGMQCDYNWDWDMPYDEESGEVDDTEVSIYPHTDLERVVNWLLEKHNHYRWLNIFMERRGFKSEAELADYIVYLESVKEDHELLKEKIASLNRQAQEMY